VGSRGRESQVDALLSPPPHLMRTYDIKSNQDDIFYLHSKEERAGLSSAQMAKMLPDDRCRNLALCARMWEALVHAVRGAKPAGHLHECVLPDMCI
jgi:hypothetical protein